MRKEVVFAVFLGLLFGLVITYGIYQANQATKNLSNNSANQQVKETKDSTAVSSPTSLLTINSPQNGEIFASDSAVIAGTVKPDTTIVILTELTEYLVTPDATGFFSQQIGLVSGVNQLDITAINSQSGERQDQVLDVVFTTSL